MEKTSKPTWIETTSRFKTRSPVTYPTVEEASDRSPNLRFTNKTTQKNPGESTYKMCWIAPVRQLKMTPMSSVIRTQLQQKEQSLQLQSPPVRRWLPPPGKGDSAGFNSRVSPQSTPRRGRSNVKYVSAAFPSRQNSATISVANMHLRTKKSRDVMAPKLLQCVSFVGSHSAAGMLSRCIKSGSILKSSIIAKFAGWQSQTNTF